MTIKSVWIVLLGMIIALATACGTPAPSNGAVPNDDAATNNPETTVPRDASSPPPDVAPRDDAGTPTPDAATPVDAAVTPDVSAPTDVATPPPPDSGMPPFDPDLCFWLRAGTYQVEGSTMAPQSVASCVMQPDGTARVHIGSSFSAAFGCGWADAVCGGSDCYFPRVGGTDNCQWTGLSLTNFTSGPRQFTATSPDGTFRVNLFTSPPGR